MQVSLRHDRARVQGVRRLEGFERRGRHVVVAGSPDQLGAFLDQLQSVQPRAVLISQATLSQPAATSGTNGRSQLQLTMNAFVAASGR